MGLPETHKTKLQVWLFDRNITMEKFTSVIGAKTAKTARQKLNKEIAFKLPEMRAVKDQLFPDKTLEEIFEGY
jgi:hypothetical protein